MAGSNNCYTPQITKQFFSLQYMLLFPEGLTMTGYALATINTLCTFKIKSKAYCLTDFFMPIAICLVVQYFFIFFYFLFLFLFFFFLTIYFYLFFYLFILTPSQPPNGVTKMQYFSKTPIPYFLV